ncbi:hypothetical protein PVL29_016343 [Vitis rotundifolia]|uniref:Uncharacterized protein n=1 Tax=Vitis rotundifolia TaxID=103349 RepID=A0AA39DG89_VITRO|nr:hypothetical protein PVL29_016343 [Vitis rotundifolia]
MSTPSRSRSLAMGDEGYFDWRESMERRQRESERQVQALLQETRRFREKNEVLRIQASSSSPPRSRQKEEATYPGNVESPFDENALTPLLSHQKGDGIGNPSYLMNCT